MITRVLEASGLPGISDRLSQQDMVDFLLLSSVSAVLILVFLLPDGTQQGLALNRESPTLVTLLTTHYVHFDVRHFASNLFVYIMAAVPAYFLCLLGDERRRFRIYFLSFIVVLPFVLSPLDLLIFEAMGEGPELSMGFSGIDAAFLGFLPLPLFAFLKERVNDDFEVPDSIVVFLVGLLTILVKYWRGFISVVLIAGGVLILAVSLRNILIRVDFEGPRKSVQEIEDNRVYLTFVYIILVYLGMAIPIIFVWGLFPSALRVSGHLVNIPIHYFGFVLGFWVPYLTWSRLD